MKKTLALILALLMVLPMLVVPTAAEETTTNVEESTLKVVPLSDCDSLTNWSMTGPAKLDKEIYSQGTGSVGFDLTGIAWGTGNVNWTWQTTTDPIDITGMNYLRFDLYLGNAAAVRNASFDVEIRDINHLAPVDTNGDGRVDTEYEATGIIHLPQYIKGEVKDGWNTVEIPFSVLRGWENYVDMTKVAYFRMFQTNPGRNAIMADGVATGEVQYSAVANIIGVENGTTAIRLDNVYFTSQSTTSEEDGYIRISNSRFQTRYSTQRDIQAFAVTFDEELDLRNYDTVLIDIFVDDLSLADIGLHFEICSGGGCDQEEAEYNVTLGNLAKRLGKELHIGWNTFEIPFSFFNTTSRYSYSGERILYGPCDMSAVDYFRLYLTCDQYKMDDDGDGKTGMELDETTGEPEREFAHHIGAGLPGFAIRNTETLVDYFAASEDVAGIYPQGGLSDFDGDGVKEWVLVNDSTAGEKEYLRDAVVRQLTFDRTAKPGYGNMVGIEFDIYVSDARAANSGSWEMEFTHSGVCDGAGELRFAGTLNTNVGETIKAGEWQTVRLVFNTMLPKRDLSKLPTYATAAATRDQFGEFQPHSFNFMRWHFGYGFTAENLVVAARNFKIIRDFGEPEVEVKPNCTAPIRMDNIDGETANSRIVIPTANDQTNLAWSIVNLKAGAVFNFATGGNATVKLATPLDVSGCDLIHFDLYLKNYQPDIIYEFEMTSAGREDAEERRFTNNTLAQITGRGDLKDGWNHVAIPIRDFFDGGCKLNAVNFFRIFSQDRNNLVMTDDTIVAVDNIYFEKLTGADTVNLCINSDKAKILATENNPYNTAWIAASVAPSASQGAGVRSMQIGTTWTNLSKDTRLSLDLYIENYECVKSTAWQLEINGSRTVDDAKESRLSGTLSQMFGAYVLNADGSKGTLGEGWNHIEVPLSAFAGTMNFSVINYVGTYNGGAITANDKRVVVAYDNIAFIGGEVAPTAPETKLVSAQPTLNESIDFTIKLQDDLNRPVALECIFTGEAGTSKTVKATDYANGFYTSMFTDIPAHRMSDLLTMKMWTLDGDKLLLADTVENYSVRNYIVNMLTDATDAKLITLLSDLLYYGAAAQTYASYNTDDLATSIDEALLAKLTPSTFTAPEKLNNVVVGAATENGPVFRSVTLVLDGTVHIRYTFTAATLDGLTLTVGGKTYTDFASADGYYYVDVPVSANQFGTVYTAHFGEDTAYAVNYSVNHYIATKHPEAGAKLGALLEALYNYGASAAAYQ